MAMEGVMRIISIVYIKPVFSSRTRISGLRNVIEKNSFSQFFLLKIGFHVLFLMPIKGYFIEIDFTLENLKRSWNFLDRQLQ